MIGQDLKNSTQLGRAEYEPADQTLYIFFKRQTSRGIQYIKYAYYHVPVEIYVGIAGSNKPTNYFNDNIKNKFPFKKIG